MFVPLTWRGAVVHPAPHPDELGGSIARGWGGLILPPYAIGQASGHERGHGCAMCDLVSAGQNPLPDDGEVSDFILQS